MAITQPIARARLNSIYSRVRHSSNLGSGTKVEKSNKIQWNAYLKTMWLSLYVTNKDVPYYRHYITVGMSLTGRAKVNAPALTLKTVRRQYNSPIFTASRIKPLQVSVKTVKSALTRAISGIKYDIRITRDNTPKSSALPGYAKKKTVKRKTAVRRKK